MTNINIDDEVHKKWTEHYKIANKIEYPTLKNFTEKKLMEIIQNES